jgi:dienelactone hydrolase
MKTFTTLAVLAAFVLASAGGARSEPLPVSAFDYQALPFSTEAVFKDAGDGTWRAVVTYSADKRTQTAEIIEPAVPNGSRTVQKPGPGVLFVHWLGDDATTNHTEFETDAIALAKRGATCVLLDAMWSTIPNHGGDWYEKHRTHATDYANSIQQVIDLRRGLDLLLSEPNVDPARIAYVGHDFGAMYGAVLAGVDQRPKYFVLMAGNPSFSEWYLLDKKPPDVAAYRAQMAVLDPMPYLARATAKGFLFQFASHDSYIPAAHAAAFASTAPLPRGVFTYNTDHALNVPDAHADRLAWLESRLF